MTAAFDINDLKRRMQSTNQTLRHELAGLRTGRASANLVEPVQVNAWIEQHINPSLMNRMKQTIRARRKRHFNAEHQHTRKKSIDLEFVVWHRLAALAQRRGKTLSETIVQLIEEAEHKEKYATTMSSLKQDLQALLGKE